MHIGQALRQYSVIGFILFIVGHSALSSTCYGQENTAGLVLHNGKIVTVDDANPEADAIAIVGDRIVAVGSNAEIRPYIGRATTVLDLDGKLAIPGFIDGHAHFLSLGHAKMKLELAGAKNWDEIIAMVGEAARNAQPGEWIRGRGWHQEKWERSPEPNIDGLPFHDKLSEISPENPVLLTHASGHAVIANAKAMELAGITENTPDPDGGEIVRGPNGEPIGVFRETAEELLDKALEDYTARRTAEQEKAEMQTAIELATEECLSRGITSFCDAGSPFATIDTFRDLADEGKLRLRLWVMINDSLAAMQRLLPEYKIIGAGNNHLTVRAIKRLMDGALGSHGAWLLEPYVDLPSSTGLNTEPPASMKAAARLAIEHGFQLCTHAIGDRANREVLDIYEETFTANPDKSDLRWRIEHAQHLHSDDIPRFGKLGVIAAMQTCHCTSDGPWVPKRIGDRRAEEGAYAWRKLFQTGAIIANGTDAPVEDVDPLANFHSAVTRQLPDGTAFYPGQCLTREEALRSYTINCAYAAFEEDIKGSLTPGKLADITVLSRDIMTIAPEEILKTEVVYTIVGGQIMYQK
jgi:predicted amidohydrolase YtcJ